MQQPDALYGALWPGGTVWLVKIVVLAVGKLRDRNVAALCDDYVARARRHLTVDVVEVEDDAALQRKWPAQGETIALAKNASESTKALASAIPAATMAKIFKMMSVARELTLPR